MRSFYLKIALIFTLIMILFGLFVAYLTLQTSSNIIQESVQRTNRDLAKTLAAEFEPILSDSFDHEQIEAKLRSLKGTNPQFDFYLLDSDGIIKSHIPGGSVGEAPKVSVVDTEKLDFFIAGQKLPILASDPVQPDREKPFSAANISIMGSEGCYLYVVLESEEFSKTTAMISESYITRNTLFIIGSVLLLGIFTGLFVFRNVTGRIEIMKQKVTKFERGELNERIPVSGNDEIAELSTCFNRMADTIVDNMEEIKKTDKLRRELIANVSHDLRSPLASIQGYLETIQLRGEKITKAEYKQYIETVIGNTRKLNKMIDDLFELSKLDAGNVRPNLEKVSVAELVQDLVLQFKPIAEKKGIELEVVFPKTPNALITADMSLLNRAITNLIDNAIKHTPEGGKVSIISTQNGKDIVIEIIDTGVGISADDIPLVFDRFYQVDKSRSNNTGAGLGLAIARKILQLHGAEIVVNSVENKGTTFRVAIPTV
ncbi:MAG: sensor histidine kinase [Balneolaceae bacterium]|nr:MAG: sensor histidine kinase [Balneolaceae bacterium]